MLVRCQLTGSSPDVSLSGRQLTFCSGAGGAMQSSGKFDLKEPYYRQLNTWIPPVQSSEEWGGNNRAANGNAWPPQQAQW